MGYRYSPLFRKRKQTYIREKSEDNNTKPFQMGKASHRSMANLTTTTTTTTVKKKGRPSRQDLLNRALQQQKNDELNSNETNPNSPEFLQNPKLPSRRIRSTRRIPIFNSEFVDGSFFDDVDVDDDDLYINDNNDDDDDDERIDKKVKLVGRLPSSSSDLDLDPEDEKGTKATDTRNETSMLASGPTTAVSTTTTTTLPDRKLLLLILDKLQKKDTRGVFAEPVDPEELPDYHEVIENPMDFATLRKNLDGGLYLILEQFEADVNLICSNAMEYNSPSTIFFRQARSIQELAKKEFETLRQEGGQSSEPPPRPRRGRPPGSRNMKKLLESSSAECAVPESSPEATLAACKDDDSGRSNSYNLRKGPSLYRFPRNLEFCFDSPPASSSYKSAPMKNVKKQYESDDSRRETYNLSGQFDSGQDLSLLTTFETFENKLIPVGLDANHSYARSLTQFAADLGPGVWKIVAKKIESALPPGVDFGPGWVSEYNVSSTQQSPPVEKSPTFLPDSCMIKPDHPSNSGFPESTITSNPSTSEWSSLKGINGLNGSGIPYQTQLDPVAHSGLNGCNGGFGTGFHFQAGSFNHLQPIKSNPMESKLFEASRNLSLNRMNSSPIDFHSTMNTENDVSTYGLPYWQSLSMQERWDNTNLAEPMAGFQASSSRNSRMPIGSPPQLDLVLQL